MNIYLILLLLFMLITASILLVRIYKNTINNSVTNAITETINGVGENIVIIDSHSNIIHANDDFLKLTGFERSSLLKKSASVFGFPQPDDEKSPGKKIWNALKNNNSWYGEVYLKRLGKKTLQCYARINRADPGPGQSAWVLQINPVNNDQRTLTILREAEKKWKTLFKILPVGVSILDQNYRITDLNPALEKIMRITREDLKKGTYKHRQYIDKDYNTLPLESFPSVRAIKEQRTVKNTQVGIKLEDGSYIWTDVSAAPLPFDDASCVIATEDITNRINNEFALQTSEDRFKRFIDNSPLGILFTKPNGEILSANPACCKILQMSESEIQKKGRSGLIDATDPRLKHALEERQRKGEIHNKRLRMIRKNGQKFEAEVSSVIFQDKSGETFTSMTLADITERLSMENHIRFLADYDQLTQVPNRHLFKDRLDQSIASGHRHNTYSALLFIDLDKFKALNDVYGHSAGDLFLIKTAQRLQKCIRESDTIARYGGDEFVIILEDLDSKTRKAQNQAAMVAEKIIKNLKKPYSMQLREKNKNTVKFNYNCQASIGIALFLGHDTEAADIILQADEAMYKAKAHGGNSYSFFGKTV